MDSGFRRNDNQSEREIAVMIGQRSRA